MKDQNLLELAALSVDMPVDGWSMHREKGMRMVNSDREFIRYWNPLVSDGDALRLATKLGFTINIGNTSTIVSHNHIDTIETIETNVSTKLNSQTNIDSATRRAIVRAAALAAKKNKCNQ